MHHKIPPVVNAIFVKIFQPLPVKITSFGSQFLMYEIAPVLQGFKRDRLHHPVPVPADVEIHGTPALCTGNPGPPVIVHMKGDRITQELFRSPKMSSQRSEERRV